MTKWAYFYCIGAACQCQCEFAYKVVLGENPSFNQMILTCMWSVFVIWIIYLTLKCDDTSEIIEKPTSDKKKHVYVAFRFFLLCVPWYYLPQYY